MNGDNINLLRKLEEYSASGMYPFHMPGHKRNTKLLSDDLPYGIDITEIAGFDNLHDAKGILKRTQDKAKTLFGSEYSYMLVNGTTCGILAAVSSAADHGDEIIIARNCHKSVYNACGINALDIHFIYPEQDIHSGVCMHVEPESVEEALNMYPDSKAVVITSPTYEGVISDIKAIAEITHSRNIPLIVDNAHGAHQRFCGSSREGEPVMCGADIVISSLHKTLLSLTQTAVANLQGGLVDHERFENYLSVFETSSPSYVLMASMDSCFDFLKDGSTAFEEYCKHLEAFGGKMKALRNLRVLCHGNDTKQLHGFFGFDKGKIVISTLHTNISGVRLMELFREKYRIELEMAYPHYAVAMTSVCDSAEGFDRLANALLETDKSLEYRESTCFGAEIPRPKKADSTTPASMICKKYIYAYPPGVPIVIPGEIIDDSTKEYIEGLKKAGVDVSE